MFPERKRTKYAVSLSADQKVAVAEIDRVSMAAAGIAHRAAIILGLSANGGEPQCVCSGVRTI